MIWKPLTCPTCGDTWKRVIGENFVRLGPPMHECRACWTPFATGEREWRGMDSATRVGYFLQNLLFVAPLAVLWVVAVLASWFFNFIGQADAMDYLAFGAKILFGIYLLLNLWSALMILLSQRRSARAAPVSRRPVPTREPEVPDYPQGRPNPRPEDPSQHYRWPL